MMLLFVVNVSMKKGEIYMSKYEVGVYRTSFNSILVEADTEQEAKDFALRMEGTGELELFPDKRAEAVIETRRRRIEESCND